MELTHREALAAFWRICWTGTVFVISALYLSVFLIVITFGSEKPPPWYVNQALIQNLWTAISLWTFAPLLLRWPYQGFRLVVQTGEGEASRFTQAQRFQVANFIFWRLFLASIAGQVLLLPINILLGIMRISMGPYLAVAASVLVAGPMIIRFLIGHPFTGFRVEVRRTAESGAS